MQKKKKKPVTDLPFLEQLKSAEELLQTLGGGARRAPGASPSVAQVTRPTTASATWSNLHPGCSRKTTLFTKPLAENRILEE